MDSGDWDERYSAAEFVWRTQPNEFVATELGALAPGTALDLACGAGRNAVWLAEREWRVTAVDFSGVALDKARTLGVRRGVEVDWVLADVTEYEPPAKAFDLVLVSYLQLPSAELAGVLASAAETLAGGGTLFVVGHDLTNLTDGVGGPHNPEVLYTPEKVSAQLCGAGLSGLRVERAERVRRTVQRDDGPREAVDTLVRATRD